MLSPEVASAFPDADAVNEALMGLDDHRRARSRLTSASTLVVVKANDGERVGIETRMFGVMTGNAYIDAQVESLGRLAPRRAHRAALPARNTHPF